MGSSATITIGQSKKSLLWMIPFCVLFLLICILMLKEGEYKLGIPGFLIFFVALGVLGWMSFFRKFTQVKIGKTGVVFILCSGKEVSVPWAGISSIWIYTYTVLGIDSDCLGIVFRKPNSYSFPLTKMDRSIIMQIPGDAQPLNPDADIVVRLAENLSPDKVETLSEDVELMAGIKFDTPVQKDP